jgi:drug/metabolite transporter (DMT)-like permease
MALFALLALFIALIVYVTSYVEKMGTIHSITDPMTQACISVAIAALLTTFYWILSPLMIRTLIDSQQPFSGNIWEVFILFGLYLIAVVGNFSLIPVGISLITFIILSVLFAGLYQYLSHNPIFSRS